MGGEYRSSDHFHLTGQSVDDNVSNSSSFRPIKMKSEIKGCQLRDSRPAKIIIQKELHTEVLFVCT